MRASQHELPTRPGVVARPVVGPLAIAVVTGVQLGVYGATVATLGAYTVLVISEAAVLGWSQLRVKTARRRLRAVRATQLR